ncbi:MAG: DUF1573 domain-containing protein [Bacteroidales bacterium]
MKRLNNILLSIAVLFAITACNQDNGNLSTDLINNPSSADEKSNKEKQPQIVFKNTEHDFGKVIDGEVVSYSYEFTNEGNGDLIITSVDADCGCTVAEYPQKPVKPGEKGYIDLQFDSRHRQGFNHKTATVLTNAVPNKVELEIKAKVYQPHKSDS